MSVKYIHIEKYDIDAFKKEQKPFSMILNDVIQKFPIDRAKEMLLWLFLESLPVTWEPNKAHITKHFGISDRTYERYMSWLCLCGLIEYRQERGESGTFSKWQLIILNGTRFNPDADPSQSVNIDGVVVNRFKNSQSVQLNHSANLPLNGEHRGTVKPVERLDDAHINTTLHLEKKNYLKKQNNGKKMQNVSVFLDQEDVKRHIEYTSENRYQSLEPDIISQIIFYIGDNLEVNNVKKKTNIALKKIRLGKWNTPQGWRGITSQSIAKKERDETEAKQIQYCADAKIFRKIEEKVLSELGAKSLGSMLKKLKS